MFTLRPFVKRIDRNIKNNNSEKEKIPGEMTVEAAFIIPVMLIILFLFVYIIFALHDRAVMLMRADTIIEEHTSPFIDGTFSKPDMGRGLFIYKVTGFDVGDNGFFYTVNLEAEAKVRLGLVDKLVGGYRYYSVHKMHRIHDYCKERRMLAVVREESEESE